MADRLPDVDEVTNVGTVHYLNCFTCNARVPSSWRTGMLCMLVETRQGLVLVDTGPGLGDYDRTPGIIRTFQLVTKVPLDPGETAVHQITRLGYRPEDVPHIVLTHMHFDHCGGLADFPQAIVHVHRSEHEAFLDRPRRWSDLAYVRRHAAHKPKLVLYDETGESWFAFPAIRLPFEPALWLVPLFGHTRGHCGVAIEAEDRWLFHVGDAAPMGFDVSVPAWFARLVLGPHMPRLLAFRAAHPDIRMTTGHVPLDYFEEGAA